MVFFVSLDMAYVYRHYRNDTKEVFYVGIGISKDRYKSRRGRNTYWKNIVNKYGYTYEIIADGITWSKACELEQLLIKEYGKKEDGGKLVNMTDGGDGILGVKLEKSMVKERNKKIQEANSSILLNLETGIYYYGLLDAARAYGVKMQTLHKYLSGRNNNKTSIRHTTESKWIETPYKKPVRKGGKPKQVINIYTGIVYDSIREASKYNDVSENVMLSRVRCDTEISSDFTYADDAYIKKRHKLNQNNK